MSPHTGAHGRRGHRRLRPQILDEPASFEVPPRGRVSWGPRAFPPSLSPFSFDAEARLRREGLQRTRPLEARGGELRPAAASLALSQVPARVSGELGRRGESGRPGPATQGAPLPCRLHSVASTSALPSHPATLGTSSGHDGGARWRRRGVLGHGLPSRLIHADAALCPILTVHVVTCISINSRSSAGCRPRARGRMSQGPQEGQRKEAQLDLTGRGGRAAGGPSAWEPPGLHDLKATASRPCCPHGKGVSLQTLQRIPQNRL